MTFREYIAVLYNTHLFGRGKLSFARRLFISASTAGNPDANPGNDAIKSWIYKEDRGYNVDRYFPNRLVDESRFCAFFRKHTKVSGSWKKIQDAFRQLKQDEYFCIDLETEDPDVFFWSLLNQFQRIFQLPESEREEKQPAVPTTVTQQEENDSEASATVAPQEAKDSTVPAAETPQEQPPEQIRNEFLETIRRYGIMDIINRDPPVLNRKDSAILNAFVKETEGLLYKDVTPPDIRSFIMTLEVRAIDLEGNLNIRFNSTDKTASINMADDKLRLRDKVKYKVKAKCLGIPELTPELIQNAADPLRLYRLAVEDWGSFRDQMNLWFEFISSGQDKT